MTGLSLPLLKVFKKICYIKRKHFLLILEKSRKKKQKKRKEKSKYLIVEALYLDLETFLEQLQMKRLT